MPTDTSEKGLESIIVASLVEEGRGGRLRQTRKNYDREAMAVKTAVIQV